MSDLSRGLTNVVGQALLHFSATLLTSCGSPLENKFSLGSKKNNKLIQEDCDLSQ